MTRALHPWLLALILLFGQQAAWVHGLSHTGLAEHSHSEDDAPASPHPAAQCVAFHAVDSVIPCGKVALDPPRITPQPPRFVALPPWLPSRIEFDSRAPPPLLS
jgi:hypothetical protein